MCRILENHKTFSDGDLPCVFAYATYRPRAWSSELKEKLFFFFHSFSKCTMLSNEKSTTKYGSRAPNRSVRVITPLSVTGCERIKYLSSVTCGFDAFVVDFISRSQQSIWLKNGSQALWLTRRSHCVRITPKSLLLLLDF